MKKNQYAIAALLLTSVVMLLFLTTFRRPAPTAKTEIGNERIRVRYGLPDDAEIKRMYAAYSEKPRICGLTPLNEHLRFTRDSSGYISFRDGIHQELKILTGQKWATYRTGNSMLQTVIVEPTQLSEKYVADDRFCLGDYVPNGRVIVKSPEVENGEIKSFRVTLGTVQQRSKGVPTEFEELEMFDDERSVGVAFEKIEGKWKIIRTAVQAYTR